MSRIEIPTSTVPPGVGGLENQERVHVAFSIVCLCSQARGAINIKDSVPFGAQHALCSRTVFQELYDPDCRPCTFVSSKPTTLPNV